jgi:hypothetical protein
VNPLDLFGFDLQTGHVLFIARFINMHIRQDAENQLRLRSRMKVGDVRSINFTGKNVRSGEQWMETYKKTLKEKVKRESVYAT